MVIQLQKPSWSSTHRYSGIPWPFHTIICCYWLSQLQCRSPNKNTVCKNVLLLLACFTSDTFSPWLEISHDSGLVLNFYGWWEIRHNHGLTLNVILMFYTTGKSLTYGNNPLSCSVTFFFFNPVDSTASTVYSSLTFPTALFPFWKGSFLLLFFKRIFWGKTFFVPCFLPAVLWVSMAAQCSHSSLLN